MFFFFSFPFVIDALFKNLQGFPYGVHLDPQLTATAPSLSHLHNVSTYMRLKGPLLWL